MPLAGKDEGEFELILGNRQIMSVFFIIVVLMGVFFAMGFLAGRSTAPQAAVAQKPSAEQLPIAVDAGKRPASETQAAPPAPQPAAPEETKPAESPKPEPARAAAKLYVEQPPAGTYLQAAATQRADAEAMLGYLSGKTGLHGYVAPSPKSPELCRVLIGPLAGNEEIAAARAKLLSLGVSNAYLVKY